MIIVTIVNQKSSTTVEDDISRQIRIALALLAAVIARYHLQHQPTYKQYKPCSEESNSHITLPQA
jgi:hypothetical protein